MVGMRDEDESALRLAAGEARVDLSVAVFARGDADRPQALADRTKHVTLVVRHRRLRADGLERRERLRDVRNECHVRIVYVQAECSGSTTRGAARSFPSALAVMRSPSMCAASRRTTRR